MMDIRPMHFMRHFFLFLGRVFAALPSSRRWFFKNFFNQIRMLGFDALFLIFIAAVFAGMVFSVQGFLSLNRFGAESSLGEYLPISMYRELGPILAALVYTGRSGSFVATEIAAMKANGQIDNMEIMGINPMSNIVLPRFLAVFLTLPGLVCFFNVVAIATCFLMAKYFYHLNTVGFFVNLQYVIEAKLELLMTFVKAGVFGLLVAWSATYFGFNATVNAEGVGKASTHCVVCATLLMLIFDFLITTWIVPSSIGV